MKMLSLFLIALLLTACGASKKGPTDGQSELQSRSGGTLSAKSVARCNLISVPAASMEGVLKAYWNGSSYTYDRVHLKINRMTSSITSNSNITLKIMRWGVTNGQTVSNGVPAPIRFLLNSNKMVINEAAPVLDISQYTISSVITSYGLATHGVTAQNFFQKVSVLVDEVDMSYDALKFDFYDSTRSISTPYASVSALIPAFHANPNHYALQNSALTLQQLHPHFSNKAASWSDAVYTSYFDQLCNL